MYLLFKMFSYIMICFFLVDLVEAERKNKGHSH